MISQLRILVPLCVRLPTAEGAHTYSRRPRSSRPPPSSPGGAAGRLGRKAIAAATCHVGGTRPGRPLCRLKNERARPANTPPPQKVAEGIAATVLKRGDGGGASLTPPHCWAGLLRMSRPAPTLAHLLSSGGDPAYHRGTVYWHRPRRTHAASGLASKEWRQ